MKYLAILLFLSSNAFALDCSTLDPYMQGQCYRNEAESQRVSDQIQQNTRDMFNAPRQDNTMELYYQNQQNRKLEQQNELLRELLNK